MDSPTISTKLVVDAGASESVLGGLRKQFELTNQAREGAQKGMGFFTNMLSVTAGTYLPQAIHKVQEWGKSFVDAASANSTAVQAMTGLIATQQNLPWDKAKTQATAYNEKLNEIAIDQSRNLEDVKHAYEIMTEIGGANPKNLEEGIKRTEELAGVSRVLGTSIEATAREVEFMGDGMLRTRGRMFQLLQTTGIFGEHTKGVAAWWQKLTDDQRTEKLNFAMDKLGSKLGKAPAGFGALLQQFHTMEDIAKEQLGTPILQAITPQVRQLVNWMKTERGSVEEFAKHSAETIGHYTEEAGRVIREAWTWAKQHSSEIKADVVAAWSFAQKVIQFAIEHKEALAIGYGAKLALGSAPAQGIIGAGKAVYGLGAGAAAAGGGTVGVAGGLAALGAFSAAIVGVGLAAWQATKLMGEVNDNQRADVRARYEYFQNMAKNSKNDFAAWDQAATAHFEYTRKKFVDEAQLLGMSKGEAEEMANASREQHEANRKMVEFAEDAAKRYQEVAQQQQGFVDVKEQDNMMAVITRQFSAAMDASNSGAEQYIANLLARSKDLQQAFLQSADMTSEGYRTLAELTTNSASDFSEALKRLGDAAAKKEKTTSKVPNVQFNGGQTFKIQQDFRDENPDRIAYVFQRDILAQAERRYQSSFASPFGA